MRISLLLEREPFGQILAATLAWFWSERYGAPYRVEWVPRTVATIPGAQTWYCNPHLNAIFTQDATNVVFGPARGEFGRATSVLRRPAQALYVRAATSRAFARRLAWPALQVTPTVPDADSILILGGNNRIRLIDFLSGESHVVAKSGLGTEFIDREIEVRTGFETLAPKLHEIDPAHRWFSEECIVGTPQNRLDSARTAHDAMETASLALHELHQATIRQEPATEYVSALTEEVRAQVQAHPWLTDEMRNGIETDTSIMGGLVQRFAASAPAFETAQTHGDFQPANILVAGSDVWQIDWEYTARRHVAYDPLVYHLEARSPQGLARRVRALASGAMVDSLRSVWPWYPWEARELRALSLAVFLLEELVFRLKESSNPLLSGPIGSMSDYFMEFRTAVEFMREAGA